jgi:C4-dicarboxylate transporter, DctM subunit
MSAFALGLTGIGAMFVMLFLRMPVWLALAITGVLGNILHNNLGMAKYVAGTVFFDTASNYNLSVIPLFVLMGEVASSSRMSGELFKAARVMLSGLRGGLAVASLAASGAFGAICGSSVATAASMTRIALPEMRKAGYDDGFASGSIAAGGSLGILIPPSIILVIYGSIAEESVARLFAAAMLPGIVLMLIYIAVALFVASRTGAVPREVAASFVERVLALRHAWQFALLFLLTIGGIYAGVFSPNEAASVGAFGAIVLGLIRRTLSLRELMRAVQTSVIVSCALFMIILGATLFSQFIVQTHLPVTLLAAAQDANLSPALVMALIIAIYVVMGCFLEGIGMVLITVPVFLPVVTGYGFDPILFGVLVAILVELGLITPPVGMNLFIIRAQVPDMPMSQLYRGIVPYLIAPLILIGLILAFPPLTLWLPEVLF